MKNVQLVLAILGASKHHQLQLSVFSETYIGRQIDEPTETNLTEIQGVRPNMKKPIKGVYHKQNEETTDNNLICVGVNNAGRIRQIWINDLGATISFFRSLVV